VFVYKHTNSQLRIVWIRLHGRSTYTHAQQCLVNRWGSRPCAAASKRGPQPFSAGLPAYLLRRNSKSGRLNRDRPLDRRRPWLQVERLGPNRSQVVRRTRSGLVNLWQHEARRVPASARASVNKNSHYHYHFYFYCHGNPRHPLASGSLRGTRSSFGARPLHDSTFIGAPDNQDGEELEPVVLCAGQEQVC
jgi:hypothetical protein